jgi:transcriptional regulator NrdR family protein
MSVAKCEKCGGRMLVSWTRHAKTGEVKRLRMCHRCKRRRATIEK